MATQKSICLYFQVHQPTRLRLYRFFDIGKDSHYYDDFANRTILRRVAQKCYLPMNQLMLELIKQNKGKFKIAYSISGSALEQFQRFAPEVIDSFKALAATGKVEFLAETYYHSLASLASESEFRHQVAKHAAKIEELFGVKPVTFRNTELIYSNGIGEMVYDLGYKTMLTEGARHIMGWKSPNYVYCGETQPKLKLLLRNYTLSDDIAFRFAANKVTAEQYVDWMKENAKDDEIVNLFMDYETFGEHQGAETGIFNFMKALPGAVLADGTFAFVTPAEAVKKHKPVSDLPVDDPISWADEVDRGIALHKLIRLVTAATAGDGYLNFMGNEFGHPEWIDFPREGNGWSYKYARRQWSLADNGLLRYGDLERFDREMVHLLRQEGVLFHRPELLVADEEKKILIFRRKNCIFALNFSATGSFADYGFSAPAGEFVNVLDSDEARFNGFSRLQEGEHHISVSGKCPNGNQAYNHTLKLYLPARCAMVLKQI